MKKHKMQDLAVYVLGSSDWGWLALTCLLSARDIEVQDWSAVGLVSSSTPKQLNDTTY